MSKMEQPNTIKILLAVCSHRSIDVSSKLSMDGLITAVPKGFRLTTVVGLEASIAKSRSTWAKILIQCIFVKQKMNLRLYMLC